MGTTLGMLLANVPVVFLGNAMAHRLPLRLIRFMAAGIFFVMGALVAFGLHE
jgi:putative Ca2+/H+ antiporter (TMEM165/GDT1 family)